MQGGEGAKSLAQAGELYAWLAEEQAERRDTVVALGGGVIGDLAGFVAATYLRGVPLVQVPTTVLAQVDSSIGGKTAVNLPQGKNLVGAFHPARLTVIDVALLDRLPRRELHNGWAEVIKTAAIFDAPLFDTLEATPPEAMDRQAFLEVIERCVRWKMQVVEEDPRERGPRMLLNFGHTIGHALEAACGYETLPARRGGGHRHGRGDARSAGALAWWTTPSVERLEGVLRASALPIRYRRSLASPGSLAATPPARDKKTQGARLRWILLTGLGQTTIRDDVPLPLVREVLEGLSTESVELAL